MGPWCCRYIMSHVGISEARVRSVVKPILEKCRDRYALRIEITQNEAGQEKYGVPPAFAVAGMD